MTNGEPIDYGLGWTLLDAPMGKKLVYHRGNKPGFSATMVRVVEDRLTVIVLSNRTEGDFSCLANTIGKMALDALMKRKK